MDPQTGGRGIMGEQSRLGTQLKLVRMQRGITAKALAEQIGVSPSLISKIENGVTNPSMDVLRKIVIVLDIKMADLMDEEAGAQAAQETRPPALTRRGRVEVVRADERKLLRLPKRGLEYQLLTPDAQGAAEFVWVELKPNEGGTMFLAHERGEESVLVLEGELDLYVGDACYHLERGDCATFDATLPHLYRNSSSGKTIWLYLAVPPTF